MKSIDIFLAENEEFMTILELPRVAELIDVCKSIEADARILEKENIELRDDRKYHEDDIQSIRQQQLNFVKRLNARAKERLAGIDEEVEKRIEIRTIGMRQLIAKLHYQIQKLHEKLLRKAA